MLLRLLAVGSCLAFVVACGGEESEAAPSFVDPTTSAIAILQTEAVAADGTAAYDVEVTVRDGAKAPLAGMQIIFEVSGIANQVTQPEPTDRRGFTVGRVRSRITGKKQLHVWVGTEGGKVLLGSRSLEFVPGQAAAIQVLGLPDTVRTGDPFTIRALIVDTAGNLVGALDDREFSIRLVAHESGAVLVGTRTTRPLMGRLAFHDLRIETIGEGFEFEISGPDFASVRSPPFTIHPSQIASLRFTQRPRDGSVDRELAPLEVVGLDRFGNPIVDLHLVVRLSLQGQGNLEGVTEKRTVDGYLTFDGLRIDTPGEFRIVASGSGLSVATPPFRVEGEGPIEEVLILHGGMQSVEQKARLAILVRDEEGARQAGVAIEMMGDDSLHFEPASGKTDADGFFHVAVSTTLAGTHGIVAVVGDRELERELVFQPGRLSIETSSLQLSRTQAAPGESTWAYVRLADRYDNPIDTGVYRLDRVGDDGGDVSISPDPMFVPDENGEATLEVMVDTPGSYGLGLFRGTSQVPFFRTRLEVR